MFLHRICMKFATKTKIGHLRTCKQSCRKVFTHSYNKNIIGISTCLQIKTYKHYITMVFTQNIQHVHNSFCM